MNTPSNRGLRRARQRGAVLMIGLVMLLMLTLVAVGIVRLSTRHTQVVNNEQVRTEATAAANYALDLVLNTPSSTWDVYAGSVGQTLYANQGTTQSADTTAASVSVTVKNLTCRRGRVLKNAELIKNVGGVLQVAPDDTTCFGPPYGPSGGVGGGSGGLTIVDPAAAGVANDDSLCGTVLWDMQAQTTDPRLLAASTTVNQGVEVRETITTLDDVCK